jgi:hypothetical protein
MPNKLQRNKRGNSRFRAAGAARPIKPADSVKDLLARVTPTLTRLTDQAARQASWRQWLEAHLPPEMVARLSGVVEREGTLVIFAESAAWSARLKYVIQEIEPQLRAAHPGISRISVRVLPKA